MKKHLFKRFSSTLIDKVVISVLFVISVFCLSPFGGPGEMGKYVAFLSSSPSRYESYDVYLAMHQASSSDLYYNHELWEEMYDKVSQDPKLLAPFKGYTLRRDLLLTGLFILINFIYYLLCELKLRASLGKRISKLEVATIGLTKLLPKDFFKRNFIFLLLMIIAVFIRFAFDASYYITIAVFFLLLDVPVLVMGRSLLDIITNTYVVTRNELRE